MKKEIATIENVPALLDLQRKAFGPLCEGFMEKAYLYSH